MLSSMQHLSATKIFEVLAALGTVTAVGCAPPTAQTPAPTPVYAKELDPPVAPGPVITEDLKSGETTEVPAPEVASAPTREPEASAPAEEPAEGGSPATPSKAAGEPGNETPAATAPPSEKPEAALPEGAPKGAGGTPKPQSGETKPGETKPGETKPAPTQTPHKKKGGAKGGCGAGTCG